MKTVYEVQAKNEVMAAVLKSVIRCPRCNQAWLLSGISSSGGGAHVCKGCGHKFWLDLAARAK